MEPRTKALIAKIAEKVTKHGSSLQQYILLKQIERDICKEISEKILADANVEYESFAEAEGKLEMDGVKVLKNCPRKVFTYSDTTTKLEKEVKGLKKYEEIAGTATFTMREFDKKKDCLFKVYT